MLVAGRVSDVRRSHGEGDRRRPNLKPGGEGSVNAPVKLDAGSSGVGGDRGTMLDRAMTGQSSMLDRAIKIRR